MPEPEENPNAFEELRLLYASSVSEIISFKQQQWHVTNYALLLDAAIVSIAKLLHEDPAIELIFLSIGAAAVLAAAWFVLSKLSNSIQEKRNRQIQVRKKFSDSFKVAWAGGRPVESVPDTLAEKPTLLWFFISVVLTGFLAVLLLLHAAL